MAQSFERELRQLGLLPGPGSNSGEVYTYEQLAAIHGHVPKCELAMLVQAGLRAQGHDRKGLFTFEPKTGHVLEAHASSKKVSLQSALQMRELGSFRGCMQSVVPTTSIFNKMRHQRTFRGHSAAVYSLAMDPLMRYVVTGSDDNMIKIWSMVTGAVLKSCRGHTAEITDIKISADAVRMATSSNDGSIRIWSLVERELGFPLSVLRVQQDHGNAWGPNAGIGASPSLGVNRTASLSERRSASAEGTPQVPSAAAQVAEANAAVDVAAANQFVINFLDWNPVVPNALAAVSSDGVCRVWDTDSGVDPVELRPANAFGRPPFIPPSDRVHLASNSIDQTPTGGPSTVLPSGAPSPATRASAGPDDANFTLMCCAWSPCGSYLAATGNLHVGFLWHWPLRSISTPPNVVCIRRLQILTPQRRRSLNTFWAVPRSQWPPLKDLCELTGHSRGVEIRSVRFSRGGERLATASADSTVRLYAPMGNPSLSPAASAHVAREPRALDLDSPPQEWRQTLVMMCQVYTPPARPNTRRPRVQATPEVQQIEWALDDRRIMAATSDFTVRVFDTLSGTQLHVLHGHTKALFELSAHPRVPDVVASWAHDGTISVWDVSNGRQLAHFSARNTFPGNGRWCDTEPICFLDGGWTSTGDALMTTDVAGQFHIFAFGPAHLNGRAAYDQFFKNDYEPFAANADGFAVSSASSRLMHLLAPPVCDYNLSPYENPYQDLAMQNKLSQGVEIRDWKRGSCPPSVLGSFSPLAAAVEWNVHHRNSRNGELAAHNAMLRYSAAQDELLDRFRAGLERQPSADPPLIYTGASLPTVALPTVIMAAPAPRPRQNTHRIPSTVNPRDMVQISGGGDSENDGAVLSNDDSDQEYVQSEGDDEPAVSGENTRTREPRRAAAAVRSSRGHALRSGHNFIDQRGDDEGEYVNESSGDEPEISSDSDGEVLPQARPGKRTGRTRQQRARSQAVLSSSISQESPASSPRAQPRTNPGGRGGQGTEGEVVQQNKYHWRPDECYNWLQEVCASGAFYVPQVGDEVAYLLKVHEQCEMENSGATGPPGPTQLPNILFRQCEPCRVDSITYDIWPAEDYQQRFTVARLELVLLDPQRGTSAGGASSSGQELKLIVDIPPPTTNFPEFVVPLRSFEEGCRRLFKFGDEVQSFMLDPNGRPQWYTGTVVEDRLDGLVVSEADMLVTDQYGRYTVEWGKSDEESSDDRDNISPWELHRPGATVDDLIKPLKGSSPAVVNACKRLEAACSEALKNASYNTPLRMLPECKFRPGVGHGGQRLSFNALVPLPISNGLILSRADTRWYRSTEQMLADCDLLLLNVKLFYMDKSMINSDAHRICEFLRKAIENSGDAGGGNEHDIDESVDLGPAARTVGRRQLLSTVGEARAAINGATSTRDATVSRVPVHVHNSSAHSGDSDDVPASGTINGRRQTRSSAHPIEASVQISERPLRRPTRSAAEAFSEGAGALDPVRRGRGADGATIDAPQRRQGSRKRRRAPVTSASEGDWEADVMESDDSMAEEADNTRRRRSHTQKRSRL